MKDIKIEADYLLNVHIINENSMKMAVYVNKLGEPRYYYFMRMTLPRYFGVKL